MAAGFGRYGMPPPASNDTGTTFCFPNSDETHCRWDVQTMWAYDLDLWPWRSQRLSVIRVSVVCQSTKSKFWWYYEYSFLIYGPLGRHSSEWSRDLTTLTFDVGAHGACGWCGLSSSIRVQSLKLIGLAIRKIWCTTCVSINRYAICRRSSKIVNCVWKGTCCNWYADKCKQI